MSVLKPGEIQILEELKEKNLTWKEIMDKTGLSHGAVSNYLNSLQIKGLIEKEIEIVTRKGKKIKRLSKRFKLRPISYASLFFKDIIDFINSYLKEIVNKDIELGSNKYERSMLFSERINYSWFFLIDEKITPELRSIYKNSLLENTKLSSYLLKVNRIIEDKYDSFILSNYKEADRKIIKKYQNNLLNLLKLVKIQEKENYFDSLYDLESSLVKIRLEKKYPGVDIPEKIIQIETEKKVQEIQKNSDEIQQPYSIEDLKEKIVRLERQGMLRKENNFTKIEEKEFDTIINFLENKKNKRIYENYISSLNNRPKALLMYPSWGFQNQLLKLKELYPNKFEEQIVNGMNDSLKKWKLENKISQEKWIKDVAKLEGITVAKVKKQIEKIKEEKF